MIKGTCKIITMIIFVLIMLGFWGQYKKMLKIAQDTKNKINQDISWDFNQNKRSVKQYLRQNVNQNNQYYFCNNYEFILNKIQRMITNYKIFYRNKDYHYSFQKIDFGKDSRPIDKFNLTKQQLFAYRIIQVSQKWSNFSSSNNATYIYFKVFNLEKLNHNLASFSILDLNDCIQLIKNITNYFQTYNTGPLFWYEYINDSFKSTILRKNNTIIKNFIVFHPQISTQLFNKQLIGWRDLVPQKKIQNQKFQIQNTNHTVPIGQTKTYINSYSKQTQKETNNQVNGFMKPKMQMRLPYYMNMSTMMIQSNKPKNKRR